MTWVDQFEIPSSDGRRTYKISRQGGTFLWGCSCPGWTKRTQCKHLKERDLPSLRNPPSWLPIEEKAYGCRPPTDMQLEQILVLVNSREIRPEMLQVLDNWVMSEVKNIRAQDIISWLQHLPYLPWKEE